MNTSNVDVTSRAPDRVVLTVVTVMALAVTSVVIRLLIHESFAARDPLYGAEILDTLAYETDAQWMLREGFAYPPIASRPPGYTWLVAFVYRCGGTVGTIRILQAVLDGLSVILVARLTWSLARHWAASVLAALFMAASPTLIYFSGERLETSWMVFWLAIHLNLFHRATLSRDSLRPWIWAGLSLSVAALIRPNVLLWLPLMAVWVWRTRSPKWTALVVASALAGILPYSIKNRVLGEEWVLISPNGGVNLWFGNVWDESLHGAIPYYHTLPGPVAGQGWDLTQRRATDAGAHRPGEVSSWHASAAWSAMLASPGQAVTRIGQKLIAFASSFAMSNNRDHYRPGSPFHVMPLRAFGWGVLFPCALLGAMFVGVRRRDSWLVWFCAAYTASVVVFFVCERHRAPMWPALSCLAAWGLVQMAQRYRRSSRSFFAAVGGITLLLALVHWDWLGHRNVYENYEIDPVGIGVVWHRRGDAAAAEQAYLRAIDRDQSDALALSNLASLRLDQARFSDSEALARRSLAADPRRREAKNALGLGLLMQGRAEDAASILRAAVDEHPDYAMIWVNLGRSLHQLGQWEAARQALQTSLRLLGDHPVAARVTALLREMPATR